MQQTVEQEYQSINFHEARLLMNGGNEKVMQLASNQEYQIFLTHIRAASTNGDSPEQHWWATLLGFPFIVETAVTRHQVLKQIKQRIADMLQNAEIVTVHASELAELGASEPADHTASTNRTGIEKVEYEGEEYEIDHDKLQGMGWTHYGIFKDDSEALLLFDEIEEERNKHWVGGDA
ncbi:MAG: hypothetical protein AAF639_25225 [Chloroflexota bacterium]